jgi:hypothetical protein
MTNEFPPQIDKVFEALFRGYHICIEDGEIYTDLTQHQAFYQRLFELLGFKLSNGEGGIFYFLPSDGKMTEPSKKLIIFMAIMYDWLANQGKEPVSFLTESHFDFDKLPHLTIEEHKKTMAQLEINDQQALLRQVIQPLERYGFLRLIDNSVIKFRKPISRFVEIFTAIADTQDKKLKVANNE